MTDDQVPAQADQPGELDTPAEGQGRAVPLGHGTIDDEGRVWFYPEQAWFTDPASMANPEERAFEPIASPAREVALREAVQVLAGSEGDWDERDVIRTAEIFVSYLGGADAGGLVAMLDVARGNLASQAGGGPDRYPGATDVCPRCGNLPECPHCGGREGTHMHPIPGSAEATGILERVAAELWSLAGDVEDCEADPVRTARVLREAAQELDPGVDPAPTDPTARKHEDVDPGERL